MRTLALWMVAAIGCGDKPALRREVRAPQEIDGFGVGPVELGSRASALVSLGFSGEEPAGSGSFTQNGKRVPATIRVGRTLSFKRGDDVVMEARIEPAGQSVDELAILGPGPATREGFGVGTPVAELRAAWGAPADRFERSGYGTCYQFTAQPSIHFCVGFDEHVRAIVIPALRRAPLSLGEDVGKLAAALEGRVAGDAVYRGGSLVPIDGRGEGVKTTAIAPCLLSVPDPEQHVTGFLPFIAHGGDVLWSDGGWRRGDGSMVICLRGDLSVFEIDPAGRAVRWSYDHSWRSEPARCRVEGSLVRCQGVSEFILEGFTGTLVGDLVVPGWRNGKLGPARAYRADGVPGDDCERLLERAWRESAPAFAFFGVPAEQRTLIAYRESDGARDFAGDCGVAKAEERACLMRSPSVLSPDSRCKLRPPYFNWRAQVSPEPEPRRLPPAEAAQRARRLWGTWRQDLGHYGERRWTFERQGRLVVDGKPRGRYRIAGANQLVVEEDGVRRLALLDSNHLFTDDHEIWCPPDLSLVNFDLGFATLLLRGETCTMLSASGAFSEATCLRRDGALEVAYRDSRPRRLVFRLVDGCYIGPRVAAFSRVP